MSTLTPSLLPCQEAYIEKMRKGKTSEDTRVAKENDQASHAELNRLRALPANAECFDCTAKKPGWAVLPHGVHVCIDCAQIHRHLGRHISQTKAINTGTYLWYPHELQVMREIGNGVAAKAFVGAPPKLSRETSASEKCARAQLKYVDKTWGPFWAKQAPPSVPSPSSISLSSAAVVAPVPVDQTEDLPVDIASTGLVSTGGLTVSSKRRLKHGAVKATRVDLISWSEVDPIACPIEIMQTAEPATQPDISSRKEPQNRVSRLSYEISKAQATAKQQEYERKKLAVISSFSQPRSLPVPMVTAQHYSWVPLAPPAMARPLSFFAEFGL